MSVSWTLVVERAWKLSKSSASEVCAAKNVRLGLPDSRQHWRNRRGVRADNSAAQRYTYFLFAHSFPLSCLMYFHLSTSLATLPACATKLRFDFATPSHELPPKSYLKISTYKPAPSTLLPFDTDDNPVQHYVNEPFAQAIGTRNPRTMATIEGRPRRSLRIRKQIGTQQQGQTHHKVGDKRHHEKEEAHPRVKRRHDWELPDTAHQEEAEMKEYPDDPGSHRKISGIRHHEEQEARSRLKRRRR